MGRGEPWRWTFLLIRRFWTAEIGYSWLFFSSRRSLENECVVYRWRRCRIPSFISLRFLQQGPQSTHTNDPSSKVLYLSRHSHHISSPPSIITQSSHSICHREPFSLISHSRRHFTQTFSIPTTHITHAIILPRSPSSPRSWHEYPSLR